jgi:hypothetical protein
VLLLCRKAAYISGAPRREAAQFAARTDIHPQKLTPGIIDASATVSCGEARCRLDVCAQVEGGRPEDVAELYRDYERKDRAAEQQSSRAAAS